MERRRVTAFAATLTVGACLFASLGFSCTTPETRPAAAADGSGPPAKAPAKPAAPAAADASGAGAGASTGVSEADFRAKLPGIDPGGLDGDQRASVLQVARDVICNCGRPTTLQGALQQSPKCVLARRMALLTKRLVEAGGSALEVSDLVEKHYDGFAPDDRHPVKTWPDQCQGPKDAPVTLVEFADFQCPYCGLAWPLIHDVVDAEKGKVRWCFVNFPLHMHEHALDAAQVAELARAKGKFFEMANTLFTNQTDLSRDKLADYAKQVGIDPALVPQALKAGTYLPPVKAQRAEGDALGINGTPTLYLNGRKYVLPLNAEMLVWSIQDEILFKQQGNSWATK